MPSEDGRADLVLAPIDTGAGDDAVDAKVADLREVAHGAVSGDLQVQLTGGPAVGSDIRGAFAGADFVIEAVFEEMSVKKAVFADAEKVVSPECILATNTSSLSITEMASELEHPERVVGFHFFNPVAVMPLLEIVRADRTDDATLATAFTVGKALKKSSVLVKDAPAFVVNRRGLLPTLAAPFVRHQPDVPEPLAPGRQPEPAGRR